MLRDKGYEPDKICGGYGLRLFNKSEINLREKFMGLYLEDWDMHLQKSMSLITITHKALWSKVGCGDKYKWRDSSYNKCHEYKDKGLSINYWKDLGDDKG
ncbi:hypothetical protein [Calorimonas adulescens]|uniref:Uncharacterized protein n=1 Tax=Calorimonas adulescens TaxID=2606906 RepID=A0A5D8QDQ7_9THEO|nr:hypothetical protein [Calorimonas adulescens]TZE82299.1 hypothetical protein FWJ32_05995 [Calorimonas adulescens]